MYKGLLAGALLLAVLPILTISVPPHQFKVPRETEGSDMALQLREYSDHTESRPPTKDTAKHLRKALRALLKLDDEELSAVIERASDPKDDPPLSSISALFHHASKNRLQKLHSLIADEDTSNLASLVSDRKRKDSDTFRRKLQKDDLKGSGDEEMLLARSDDEGILLESDDERLLAELNQLSSYLDKQAKKQRIQKITSSKRKRHSHHYARKEAYYQYWLKAGTCPKTSEGLDRMHCPTPDEAGEWVCVDDQELCDGYSHCPNDEDENPKACLFYKTVHNYLEFFTTAVLTAIRRH